MFPCLLRVYQAQSGFGSLLAGERRKQMQQLSGSEWLFYGGILVMGAAAVLALISMIGFKISGRALKKQLEEEYGKPGR